ncbi:unnamed protein product, partial [Didymodactylos carnosus]
LGDIIIERWIPYGAQAKRKTIVQRAAAAQQYKAPRNIIIQYEPIQARVVRQFQRLGVQQENPQSYVQRYGVQLRDSVQLLQEARAAGVVEDISPPAAAVAVSSASYSAESVGATGVAGSEFSAEYAGAGGASSSYESSSLYGTGAAGYGGLEAGGAGGYGSSFESSSYSSTGDLGGVGIAGGLGGGYDASGLSGSASYSSSSYGVGAGGVDAAFQAADTNRDGSLSQSEFRNFVGNNL